MPRPALKVGSASSKTRWTLAQNTTPLQSPDSPTKKKRESTHPKEAEKMNTNGFNFEYEPTPPQSDEYDALMSPAFERPPLNHAMTMNRLYDDYNDDEQYEPQRGSTRLSLNTGARAQPQSHDAIAQHMLYETALLDTQAYEILKIDEVDALKKEYERLNSRVESTQRKLALESKVKNAAQNLHRLYASKRQSRPDTPQSPISPKKSRSSLLGGRRESNVSMSSDKSLNQAEDELGVSIKKVDELNEALRGLVEKRQDVERRLLRHTAAVLAVQTQTANEQSQLQNGHFTDDDEQSEYSPDAFDGIRDILVGKEAGSLNKLRKKVTTAQLQEEHEHQLESMQGRIEQLNSQLRSIITEANQSRGGQLGPELDVQEQEDAGIRLSQHVDRLADSVRLLNNEQHETQQQHFRAQEDLHEMKNAVEEQLERLNAQMHRTMQLSDTDLGGNLHEPPQITGRGYQTQMQYLEQSLIGLDSLLQHGKEQLLTAKDSGAVSKKADEYENVVTGLWDLLQSDGVSPRPSFDAHRGLDDDNAHLSPRTPSSATFKESFSLPAFNSLVQNLFNRMQSAREQQDILRRQIQQQRELNGKSDAEKDEQLADFQTKLDTLGHEHALLQEEYTKVAAQHAQSESDASHLRAEFMNVENEIDQIKRHAEAKYNEREEMAKALEGHKEARSQMQEHIDSLEEQIAEYEDDHKLSHVETEGRVREMEEKLSEAHAARQEVEARHTTLQSDMGSLETEVVRLTTELTMAKAELDGAYGSRAERAKEAKGAEVETLTAELENLKSEHKILLDEADTLREAAGKNSRIEQLEHELRGMTEDFQELTRESLQLEKEREQLETLIDGLRDRCDNLESQLTDEKVRWLGAKSPLTTAADGSNAGPGGMREMTSTLILRQEFKKMMRETRTEGVKLLRAEQEERRKLESELRRLRQGSGALRKAASSSAQVS
ncbi:hypothetical protein K431DRAFT_240474 [Polychaeton citri CBS 116435]|uniref:Up-regulated during septation protein 1 domain-containing protein n=1 Tax=Polychaeton citri CBS 116435 TaxID=1314669 RepID=A0A9P4QCM3_9PEZI|nr:hypothetical protein K431DRAFT_240474 [Polychaeton citri CBS 116435]